MSAFQATRSRGLIYSFSILFNRVVPTRLFRMRLFQIFQLKPTATIAPKSESSDLTILKCQTAAQRMTAAKLTFRGTTDAEQESQRETAWLAIRNDQAAGGLWTSHDCFVESELGVKIDLPKDTNWLFAAFVDKAHRKQGIYRRLLAEVLRRLQNDGSTHVFVAINPTNRASMAAHKDVIQSTVGTCLAVRIGRLAFCISVGKVRPFLSATARAHRTPLSLRWDIDQPNQHGESN